MYVYKIYSLLGDKCYIGSTKLSLNERFCIHKSEYKKWKIDKNNDKIMCYYLFDEYHIENCCIELIEEVNDIEQLRIREQFWIDNTENTVNKNKAYVPIELQKEKEKIRKIEYYKNNVEKWQKRYKNNIEHINKIKRVQIQCECGNILTKQCLKRHKKENCKLTKLENI